MTVNTLGTLVPDNLMAGDLDGISQEVTILAGQNLLRGTVLGQITAGAVPTTGTAGGGNTGTGTCVSVTGGRRVKVGMYTLTCIAATTNKGSFMIVDPDSKPVGVAVVGTAFTSEQINLSLTDATDFVVGDSFTIVVPAGSLKYKMVDKTAVDGSGVALFILIENADATSADKVAIAYEDIVVNQAAIILTSGTVAADVVKDLRLRDIILRTVMGV